MAPILRGDLRYFPPSEILDLLSRHGHDGTLTVERDGRTVRVAFREGKIVGALSDEAGATGVPEIVLTLFDRLSGKFSFTDAVEIAPAVEIDAPPLIEEGKRRMVEIRRAASIYPDGSAMVRVVEQPDQPNITMNADEFRLLMRIGSGRSLDDLGREHEMNAAQLYPIVRNLEAAGLVVVRESDEFDDTAEKETESGKTTLIPRTTIRPMGETAGAQPETAGGAAGAAQTTAGAPPQPGSAPLKPPARPQKRLVGSLTGDSSGDVHLLDEDEYTIGRDATNRIPIPDGSVSSRHARIVRAGEGFEIEDLQSRNGTFVNGEKVSGRKALSDNDLIRIGKIVLTFNLAHDVRVDQTSPEARRL